MRTVVRNGVSEDPAGSRCCLEAAVAPAGIEVETLDRRLADDGAAVHGHVHDTAPVAEQLDPGKMGEEGETGRDDILDDRQVSTLCVGVVAIEVTAKDQAALVRLADVEVVGAV